VDLSAIVPLPISAADDKAAAFLPLAGEAALPRVVSALIDAVIEPGRVVVAAAQPLIDDARESLASQGFSTVSLVEVGGTGNRARCIAAALAHLDGAAFSTSHVLLHDMSQPLVSSEVRDRVVAGLHGGGGVVMPAHAVTDSVKLVDGHGSVTGTVDRSALRAVQYPRGFDVHQLAALLSRAASSEFDELAAVLAEGVRITVVDGDADGFRVELPRDLQFVEAVMGSRPPDLRGS